MIKKQSPCILVTGFTPFGGETINPSFEAVRGLPNTIQNVRIIKKEIPTSFTGAPQVLKTALEDYAPDAILCVGQHGGISSIDIEKVAINFADARIPDNNGDQPSNCPLIEDGPDAYFSTLPYTAMLQALKSENIPCKLSLSAGSFVCNCVLYNALHLCQTTYPNTIAGFVHVPYMENQIQDKPVNTPYMELKAITKAIYILCETILNSIYGEPS